MQAGNIPVEKCRKFTWKLIFERSVQEQRGLRAVKSSLDKRGDY